MISPGSRARRFGGAALAVLACAGVAAFAHHWAPVESARARASRPAVPASAFASRKVRTGLMRAGTLFLQPPANLLRERPRDAAGQCAAPAIGPWPIPPGGAPSTLLAPPAERARRDFPLVSLYLEPCRLKRIVENPEGFGADWEEAGWVTVFDRGAVRFESPAGVRLHGGFTRKSHVNKSFRLYFRDRYGAQAFPADLLAPALGPGGVEQVVLHNDLRRDHRKVPWHFVNPLGYDIARRLGGLAPETLPVRLLVNGEPRPPYVLTERLDREWLRRRFGHDQFDFLRAKGAREPADQARWDEAARWAIEAPAPLRLAEVEKRFDLDNLSRWLVSMMVCSTGDLFQAVMARDRRPEAPDGRWFFVHWDLDMSFRRPLQARTEGWQRDQLRFVMDRPPGTTMPPRIVLHRLFNEDPEYRQRFLRLFVDLVNHRLDAAFLRERLDHYAGLARAFPVGDTAYLAELERFWQLRPDELYRQLSTHFQVGPPQPVVVRGPVGALLIDGYEAPAEYRGRYPAGMTITVQVAPEWRGRLTGWRVHGDLLATGDEATLTVDGPLVIEAVVAP